MKLNHRRLSKEDGVTWKGRLRRETAGASIAWHFIHIPKTAGSSFQFDSERFMAIGDTLKGSMEHSLAGTPGPIEHMVVLLRRPRAQVLSQFLECKYDSWFTKRTGSSFPGFGQLSEPLQGFAEWTEHFTKAGPGGDGGLRFSYQCYNPWNLQSRYLTSSKQDWRVHVSSGPAESMPVLDEAKAKLKQVAVVGLAEHYEASLCLLMFRYVCCMYVCIIYIIYESISDASTILLMPCPGRQEV